MPRVGPGSAFHLFLKKIAISWRIGWRLSWLNWSKLRCPPTMPRIKGTEKAHSESCELAMAPWQTLIPAMYTRKTVFRERYECRLRLPNPAGRGSRHKLRFVFALLVFPERKSVWP